MKEIYLIRHGETDYNKQGIVQGSKVNTSLNDTGRLQAQAFFETYAHLPFDIVFTSALKRTHETVKPFIDKGIPWVQFAEINEMSWGYQEGKQRTLEMSADYQKVMDEWAKGNFYAKLQDGESPAEVYQRCQVFVNQLFEQTENTILICAHGRLNRVLVCALLGQGLEHMENYEHQNTGLYTFRQQEHQIELILQNDEHHFEAIASSIL
ncbi:MAG: histidine phosphatase family protein [Saprospiraceae bacterium]|nr:histidine phosphatase family protein [Saprospiraceae bacterium]